MANSRDPVPGEPTHGSGRRNADLGTGSDAQRLTDPARGNDVGGPIMPDDKSDRGAADRGRVAGEQQYEVAYFAKKHGLTTTEAEHIIRSAGPSRRKADEMASRK